MGLDMYIYVGENKRKIKKGAYQKEYYYRKYNFLFKYLADNIKSIKELDDIDEVNCSYVKLNVRAIKKLVKYCKEILADNSKATKLLPTCEGFFFGPTSYDEQYFEDIQYVMDNMQDLLNFIKDNPKSVIYYYPSY